jgi:ABC-type Mn2+/Zn2+ transport system permease subunit
MFSEPFMLIALGVGLLTGALCAYLGNFLLLKNMTFISIALSEIAALGVAVGLTLHFLPSVSALLLTFVAVIWFWQQGRKGRRANEGQIGVLYAASAALATIVIARNPMLESHGVDLINGNLLYCTDVDLLVMALVSCIVALPHVLFRRQFLFVSSDQETAKAQGLRSDLWDLLLMLSIGLCISLCMRFAGVLFVFASLIIPGMAGLVLSRRVSLVFCASVLIALCSVFLGFITSYRFDLPASPAIICVYALSYAGCLLWRLVVQHRHTR